VPDPTGACGTDEQVVFDNAEARTDATGDALLMDEWGNTGDVSAMERIAREADQHMVGWTNWAYEDCCNSPGQVVTDGTKPPAGSNLNLAVLKALVRAYPQAIAGTPSEWSYDPNSERFHLKYSTRLVSARPSGRKRTTVIEVPPLHYPTGYSVSVKGARVISAPDADPLLLRARRSARSVTVSVTPARHHPRPGGIPGRCRGRGRRIRVRSRGEGRIVKVVVVIDGRVAKRVHGHDLHRVRLPAGLTNGTIVKTVATTSSGARTVAVRHVRKCGLTRATTSRPGG
jgi:hypothetical protein